MVDTPDLTTADKVREYFGYGVWEAYGGGRVTVGVGNGYAVGSEGGEATHTLTVEEMPYHRHVEQLGDGSENQVVNKLRRITDGGTNNGAYTASNWKSTGLGAYVFTDYAGGDKPHNNLQPYRVVYRWRRIA